MKWTLAVVVIVLAFGFLGREQLANFIASQNIEEPDEEITILEPQDAKDVTLENGNTDDGTPLRIPERAVVAENLTIPWDIAFLPSGDMLVSERSGRIVRLSRDEGILGEISIEGVSHRGEGGLLGMTLHPDFKENGWLYLYMTTMRDDGSGTINRVVRYRLSGSALTDGKVIVDDIPGAAYHDGGRIAFGPDGLLYVTTGDATVSEYAADTGSLAGKILRFTDDGSISTGNPFGNAVYSYGHRNPQGLTWDDAGNLWSTEHGRTTLTLTGMDEVNLIVPGGNYGWPESEGDTVLPGTVAPKIHSGPSVTWAPASALFWDGSVFFGGLRGETLYEAVLSGTEVVELKEHFTGEFGRIRSVVRGPDGAFYLTTSNRDGRGDVRSGDDKIVRLNPLQFRDE